MDVIFAAMPSTTRCASANAACVASTVRRVSRLWVTSGSSRPSAGTRAASAFPLEVPAMPAAAAAASTAAVLAAASTECRAPSACDRVAAAPAPSWAASAASRAGLVLAGGGGRSRVGLGGGTRASPGVSPTATRIRGPGSAPGFLGGVGGIP